MISTSKEDLFFDTLSSKEFRNHSNVHWSKSTIIEKSVFYLKKNEVEKVLDIGSGIGKFCILGTKLSNISFTGVELRENLFNESQSIKKKHCLSNVHFIHDDIKNIDFSSFDAFYYYNPFCEHLATADIIDDNHELSEERYYEYEEIVLGKLNNLSIGTIMILHNSKSFTLSEDYTLEEIHFDGELTFWKKTK